MNRRKRKVLTDKGILKLARKTYAEGWNPISSSWFSFGRKQCCFLGAVLVQRYSPEEIQDLRVGKRNEGRERDMISKILGRSKEWIHGVRVGFDRLYSYQHDLSIEDFNVGYALGVMARQEFLGY
jgi:hypothetical protein